jgi:NADPH:quinone reductase-like Zn-dependent oxidoreductase
MKAAVVRAYSEPPRHEDFDDPEPQGDETMVSVRAAGIHPLVKALAAGTHYGSDGRLPIVAGVDGVGRTADGRPVYFGMVRAPHGTMAERAAASKLCVPIPEGMSEARCAGMVNPGISGWLALSVRARLTPGETVLVLGATGAAGGLAVQTAKRLGAGRVIAAGRDALALAGLLHLGADATVKLDGTREEIRTAIADTAGPGGIHVIVDYVWGPPAEAAIDAVTRRGLHHDAPRVRFVQVGDLAGKTIALPAAVLRSSGLELLGSGIGSVSTATYATEIPRFLAVAPDLTFEVEEMPLAEVTRAWTLAQGSRRIVLVPSA